LFALRSFFSARLAARLPDLLFGRWRHPILWRHALICAPCRSQLARFRALDRLLRALARFRLRAAGKTWHAKLIRLHRTASLLVVFRTAVRYRIWCAVDSHAKLGMNGDLLPRYR